MVEGAEGSVYLRPSRKVGVATRNEQRKVGGTGDVAGPWLCRRTLRLRTVLLRQLLPLTEEGEAVTGHQANGDGRRVSVAKEDWGSLTENRACLEVMLAAAVAGVAADAAAGDDERRPRDRRWLPPPDEGQRQQPRWSREESRAVEPAVPAACQRPPLLLLRSSVDHY